MKKKILVTLAVVACALLLVAGSIVGTLAYLTSTASVTNTFTVGNVTITMTESKVDKYGAVVAGADRVAANEYKLIPGHTYTKDPVIYVEKGSEACYLFVEVTDGLTGIQDTATIVDQLDGNGWKLMSGNVWYLETAVDAREADKDLEIATFTYFKVKGDAEVKNYVTENNAEAVINVVAYAVQADGFATPDAAWNATYGAPANP